MNDAPDGLDELPPFEPEEDLVHPRLLEPGLQLQGADPDAAVSRLFDHLQNVKVLGAQTLELAGLLLRNDAVEERVRAAAAACACTGARTRTGAGAGLLRATAAVHVERLKPFLVQELLQHGKERVGSDACGEEGGREKGVEERE